MNPQERSASRTDGDFVAAAASSSSPNGTNKAALESNSLHFKEVNWSQTPQLMNTRDAVSESVNHDDSFFQSLVQDEEGKKGTDPDSDNNNNNNKPNEQARLAKVQDPTDDGYNNDGDDDSMQFESLHWSDTNGNGGKQQQQPPAIVSSQESTNYNNRHNDDGDDDDDNSFAMDVDMQEESSSEPKPQQQSSSPLPMAESDQETVIHLLEENFDEATTLLSSSSNHQQQQYYRHPSDSRISLPTPQHHHRSQVIPLVTSEDDPLVLEEDSEQQLSFSVLPDVEHDDTTATEATTAFPSVSNNEDSLRTAYTIPTDASQPTILSISSTAGLHFSSSQQHAFFSTSTSSNQQGAHWMNHDNYYMEEDDPLVMENEKEEGDRDQSEEFFAVSENDDDAENTTIHLLPDTQVEGDRSYSLRTMTIAHSWSPAEDAMQTSEATTILHSIGDLSYSVRGGTTTTTTQGGSGHQALHSSVATSTGSEATTIWQSAAEEEEDGSGDRSYSLRAIMLSTTTTPQEGSIATTTTHPWHDSEATTILDNTNDDCDDDDDEVDEQEDPSSSLTMTNHTLKASDFTVTGRLYSNSGEATGIGGPDNGDGDRSYSLRNLTTHSDLTAPFYNSEATTILHSVEDGHSGDGDRSSSLRTTSHTQASGAGRGAAAGKGNGDVERFFIASNNTLSNHTEYEATAIFHSEPRSLTYLNRSTTTSTMARQEERGGFGGGSRGTGASVSSQQSFPDETTATTILHSISDHNMMDDNDDGDDDDENDNPQLGEFSGSFCANPLDILETARDEASAGHIYETSYSQTSNQTTDHDLDTYHSRSVSNNENFNQLDNDNNNHEELGTMSQHSEQSDNDNDQSTMSHSQQSQSSNETTTSYTNKDATEYSQSQRTTANGERQHGEYSNNSHSATTDYYDGAISSMHSWSGNSGSAQEEERSDTTGDEDGKDGREDLKFRAALEAMMEDEHGGFVPSESEEGEEDSEPQPKDDEVCNACGFEREYCADGMIPCQRCQRVFYCSPDCREWDWSSNGHDKLCVPFDHKKKESKSTSKRKTKNKKRKKNKKNPAHVGKRIPPTNNSAHSDVSPTEKKEDRAGKADSGDQELRCNACGFESSYCPEGMIPCGRCRAVVYCSMDCLTWDWETNGHDKVCVLARPQQPDQDHSHSSSLSDATSSMHESGLSSSEFGSSSVETQSTKSNSMNMQMLMTVTAAANTVGNQNGGSSSNISSGNSNGGNNASKKSLGSKAGMMVMLTPQEAKSRPTPYTGPRPQSEESIKLEPESSPQKKSGSNSLSDFLESNSPANSLVHPPSEGEKASKRGKVSKMIPTPIPKPSSQSGTGVATEDPSNNSSLSTSWGSNLVDSNHSLGTNRSSDGGGGEAASRRRRPGITPLPPPAPAPGHPLLPPASVHSGGSRETSDSEEQEDTTTTDESGHSRTLTQAQIEERRFFLQAIADDTTHTEDNVEDEPEEEEDSFDILDPPDDDDTVLQSIIEEESSVSDEPDREGSWRSRDPFDDKQKQANISHSHNRQALMQTTETASHDKILGHEPSESSAYDHEMATGGIMVEEYDKIIANEDEGEWIYVKEEEDPTVGSTGSQHIVERNEGLLQHAKSPKAPPVQRRRTVSASSLQASSSLSTERTSVSSITMPTVAGTPKARQKASLQQHFQQPPPLPSPTDPALQSGGPNKKISPWILHGRADASIESNNVQSLLGSIDGDDDDTTATDSESGLKRPLPVSSSSGASQQRQRLKLTPIQSGQGLQVLSDESSSSNNNSSSQSSAREVEKSLAAGAKSDTSHCDSKATAIDHNASLSASETTPSFAAGFSHHRRDHQPHLEQPQEVRQQRDGSDSVEAESEKVEECSESSSSFAMANDTTDEDAEAEYRIRRVPITLRNDYGGKVEARIHNNCGEDRASTDTAEYSAALSAKPKSKRRSAASSTGLTSGSLAGALQHIKAAGGANSGSSRSGDSVLSSRSQAQSYKDFREAYARLADGGSSSNLALMSFRQAYNSDQSAFNESGSGGSVQSRQTGVSSSGSLGAVNELKKHFDTGSDGGARSAEASATSGASETGSTANNRGGSDHSEFSAASSKVGRGNDSVVSHGSSQAGGGGLSLYSSQSGLEAGSVMSSHLNASQNCGYDSSAIAASRHSKTSLTTRRESMGSASFQQRRGSMGSVISRRGSGDTTRSTMSRSEALKMSINKALRDYEVLYGAEAARGAFRKLAQAVLSTNDKDESETALVKSSENKATDSVGMEYSKPKTTASATDRDSDSIASDAEETSAVADVRPSTSVSSGDDDESQHANTSKISQARPLPEILDRKKAQDWTDISSWAFPLLPTDLSVLSKGPMDDPPPPNRRPFARPFAASADSSSAASFTHPYARSKETTGASSTNTPSITTQSFTRSSAASSDSFSVIPFADVPTRPFAAPPVRTMTEESKPRSSAASADSSSVIPFSLPSEATGGASSMDVSPRNSQFVSRSRSSAASADSSCVIPFTHTPVRLSTTPTIGAKSEKLKAMPRSSAASTDSSSVIPFTLASKGTAGAPSANTPRRNDQFDGRTMSSAASADSSSVIPFTHAAVGLSTTIPVRTKSEKTKAVSKSSAVPTDSSSVIPFTLPKTRSSVAPLKREMGEKSNSFSSWGFPSDWSFFSYMKVSNNCSTEPHSNNQSSKDISLTQHSHMINTRTMRSTDESVEAAMAGEAIREDDDVLLLSSSPSLQQRLVKDEANRTQAVVVHRNGSDCVIPVLDNSSHGDSPPLSPERDPAVAPARFVIPNARVQSSLKRSKLSVPYSTSEGTNSIRPLSITASSSTEEREPEGPRYLRYRSILAESVIALAFAARMHKGEDLVNGAETSPGYHVETSKQSLDSPASQSLPAGESSLQEESNENFVDEPLSSMESDKPREKFASGQMPRTRAPRISLSTASSADSSFQDEPSSRYFNYRSLLADQRLMHDDNRDVNGSREVSPVSEGRCAPVEPTGPPNTEGHQVVPGRPESPRYFQYRSSLAYRVPVAMTGAVADDDGESSSEESMDIAATLEGRLSTYMSKNIAGSSRATKKDAPMVQRSPNNRHAYQSRSYHESDDSRSSPLAQRTRALADLAKSNNPSHRILAHELALEMGGETQRAVKTSSMSHPPSRGSQKGGPQPLSPPPDVDLERGTQTQSLPTEAPNESTVNQRWLNFDLKRFCSWSFIILFLLAAPSGVALLVVLRQEEDNSNPSSTTEYSGVGNPNDRPQQPQVPSPSNAPTSSPTISAAPTMTPTPLLRILKLASSDGGTRLEQSNSPQNLAYRWLLDTDSSGLSDRQMIQRYALATLYRSTSGGAWAQNYGWISNSSECEWFFRTTACEVGQGVITTLDLAFNNLDGSIPPEIGMLTGLTTIDLSGGYGGKLSGELPTELGLLTALQVFKIMGNNIAGQIPSGLNWPRATLVDLSKNKLMGGLPADIWRMGALQNLNTAHNDMSGGLTSSIGSLLHLEQLDLRDNLFSGAIPVSIGNLGLLQTLNLARNRFTFLPDSFGNLAHLQNFEMSENNLTGPLFDNWGSLGALVTLNLQKNQIDGPIPPSMGSLSKIERLDLSHNMFSGSIPARLGNLKTVYHLLLNSNRLSGPIPSALSGLSALSELRLDDNYLQGTVPPALCFTLGLSNVTKFYSDCRADGVAAVKIRCPLSECCTHCCTEGICQCVFTLSLSFLC